MGKGAKSENNMGGCHSDVASTCSSSEEKAAHCDKACYVCMPAQCLALHASQLFHHNLALGIDFATSHDFVEHHDCHGNVASIVYGHADAYW